MKPRVGVDVDGVLADLLTPCLRIASEMIGKELTVDHMLGWDLDHLFPDKKLIETFWLRIGEPGVCRNLEPYPEAVAGLAALREVADVYIVTSYLHDAPQWVHERDQWVTEHFGIPRSKMVHTKAKYTFAGKMLVDDKPQNIEEWAREHEKGIPVLWEQPYTGQYVFGGDLEYRVVRMSDWGKLVALVLSCSGAPAQVKLKRGSNLQVHPKDDPNVGRHPEPAVTDQVFRNLKKSPNDTFG